ncbi:MAG: glycine cleavage system protein GcvH [Halothiobacillaceae bacterium]|jgi:glycine cleavage system H protein|nr:glycine cleavage system protein GcvH [Halothiobacillaceae bacterium]
MSTVPQNLKYGPSHEWVRAEADGTLTLGVTDHGQSLLGDLVFVQLPEPGSALVAGQPCAVVESVKSASDVLSPVNGEVVELNSAVVDSPETVNDDAFGGGWLVRIRPSGEIAADWMDAAAYSESIT